MTPIGARLEIELDDEYHRMQNEWFFKWHHIGGYKAVEIESFRGKPITYAGIKFSDTARLVYWDTIQHYLRKKIASTFEEVEHKLPAYPINVRRNSIKEAADLISIFAARIRAAATEKDRILRGDGLNFPSAFDAGQWNGCHRSDIDGYADALLASFCDENASAQSRTSRLKEWYDDNQVWVNTLGIVIGFASLLATVL